jgi:hypothetical protein
MSRDQVEKFWKRAAKESIKDIMNLYDQNPVSNTCAIGDERQSIN